MRPTFVPRFFNIRHARILSRGRAKRRKNRTSGDARYPAKRPFSALPDSPWGSMAEGDVFACCGQVRKKSGQRNQPHPDRRKKILQTQTSGVAFPRFCGYSTEMNSAAPAEYKIAVTPCENLICFSRSLRNSAPIHAPSSFLTVRKNSRSGSGPTVRSRSPHHPSFPEKPSAIFFWK